MGSWLDARDVTGPFFLYVHNAEPHNPYIAPPEIQHEIAPVPPADRRRVNRLLARYRRLTRIDWVEKRELGRTDNTPEQLAHMKQFERLRPTLRDLYDADVRHADTKVESVIAELKRRDLWSRTLFILLSDHGEEFGEHGGWQHDRSVYQELLHVPLIVHLPEGRHAGAHVEAPVSLVDVLPTILAAIGRPDLARDARGQSLLPLIGGESQRVDSDPRVSGMRVNRKKYFRLAKDLRGDVNVALRQGHWKGIWNAEPGTLELYDLSSDPEERTDLHAEQPERATAWREAATKWLDACEAHANAPAATEPLSEEARAGLRALGYLE